MSRHIFGKTAADWIFQVDGTTADAEPVTATAVQFFTALTGGTLVTDLEDNLGNPITSVTTDSNGFIPFFQGPDTAPNDTWKLAADANGGAGPRAWIFAVDEGDQLNSLAATQAANSGSIATLQAQAPVYVYYNTVSASYPNRPSTGAPVWWVGPVAPAFGGAFAIDGLDYWIGPSA